MNTQRIGALCLGTVFALFSPNVKTGFSQGHSDGGCRPVRIVIVGVEGHPIPGAIATAGGRWQTVSDNSGVVAFGCELSIKPPFVVEASAAGYLKRDLLIREFTDGPAEIVLRRPDTRTPGMRGVVSAGELAPAVQERSEQLQRAAAEAFRRADYAAADSLFREALELTPSAAAIYNNLAVTSARRNRYDLAADWLEKALAVAPYDGFAAGNLGLIRWTQSRFEESYRLLQLAFGHGFAFSAGHYVMGLLALRKGSADEAIKHLSKISPKEYHDRDLFLSIAYRKAEKPAAAGKTYRAFLKRNPAPWLAAAHVPPLLSTAEAQKDQDNFAADSGSPR